MNVSYNYDQDFYAWLIQNAQLMRNGQLHQIDIEHIAEELEPTFRTPGEDSG